MTLGVEFENGLDGRGAGARGEQQDARPHDGPKRRAHLGEQPGLGHGLCDRLDAIAPGDGDQIIDQNLLR